jgi:hypothetical protein
MDPGQIYVILAIVMSKFANHLSRRFQLIGVQYHYGIDFHGDLIGLAT